MDNKYLFMLITSLYCLLKAFSLFHCPGSHQVLSGIPQVLSHRHHQELKHPDLSHLSTSSRESGSFTTYLLHFHLIFLLRTPLIASPAINLCLCLATFLPFVDQINLHHISTKLPTDSFVL